MRHFTIFFFLFILFSQCTVGAQDNLKYRLPKEAISKYVEDIYLYRDNTSAENWMDLYENMDSVQYVGYINYQALHASVKYGITLNDAICILANRINYSMVLFGKMPNKLTIGELEKIANMLYYSGLVISLDPDTWDNREIEKDFVVKFVDKNFIYKKTAIFPAKSSRKDCYLGLATSSKDNLLLYLISTKYLSVDKTADSLRLNYCYPVVLMLLDNEDFLSTMEVQLVCPQVGKEKNTILFNNNL